MSASTRILSSPYWGNRSRSRRLPTSTSAPAAARRAASVTYSAAPGPQPMIAIFGDPVAASRSILIFRVDVPTIKHIAFSGPVNPGITARSSGLDRNLAKCLLWVARP